MTKLVSLFRPRGILSTPIPGFPGDSNTYIFYRINQFQSFCNTLRLHLRLVRALQIAGGSQKCFIHRACDSLEIGLPQVISRGLYHDVEVLQWSKLDGFWGTQNETKTTPNCTFALHLLTATAPHKQLQPANLRDAPDGVYEGVGCARQQSEAARNDSRGVFANSKLRPSSTQNSQNRKTIPFHAREPSAMATSPIKKRFSQEKCCSPGGCLYS